ncbi:putative terpene synthase [Trifolium repens]|nr:putative terpene synthase [Trifolium repens]
MSSQACLSRDAKSDMQRNVADFHPNIWGDYFIRYASESTELDQNIMVQIEPLKNNVRKMLVSKTEEPLTKVHLIDLICRLGLSYHFENEIEEILQRIHKNYVENGEIITFEDNLNSLAVLFRLLRQHGLHVSPNVFNKFKDENGNFSEKLIENVKGMLSLYEATHIMCHGEKVLEEALVFTTSHLESIANQLNHSHAIQVKHSLRQPLHKNMPRLEARNYISFYEQDPSHDKNLLILAKLDFNILQRLHQNEFGNVCKWYKELDVPNKLPFVRDKMVESCILALAVYFEPQYSAGRIFLAKLVMIMTVVDDIYDAYGTIDELELFTNAIERWNISCLDNLPDYMQIPYKMVLDLSEEIEQKMTRDGRVYALNYYVKEFKKYIQGYITEARWLNNKYQPTLEEYIRLTIESGGYKLMLITCYIDMGDIVTENILKWITNDPKIYKDSFTNSKGEMKSFIKALLVEPVEV